MTRRMLRAAAAAAVAAAVATGTAGAITPANGGDVGGTIVAVNNGPGDQTEPRVSGDLAVYTQKDFFGGSVIHYFDFATTTDRTVPVGAPGDSDNLSDVSGNRIAFSRTRAADNQTAVMVFDTATGAIRELDPQPVKTRFGAVVGGDTVAYQELAAGSGDIVAYDLAVGTATNLTQSLDSDGNPAVAPAGDVVVWERCVGSNCDILQAVRSGGVWGAPTPVSATLYNESNPDTDGTTVVYASERPSETAQDIYLKSVGGGSEVALQLAGFQRNPSISRGVVAFETSSVLNGTADVYLYVIATNTLYRVTDTPTVNETLNDVSVLSNGAVRLVWAAEEPSPSTDHDIYARTFTVPLTSPRFTATVQQPINGDGSSVFRASRGAIPVKFTLAVGGSPTCALPPATIAVTRLAGSVTGALNESEYLLAADAGSSFRIDGCQYVYNLNAKALSAGLYRVEVLIDGAAVGSATFELR